ncbi:MAG: hypothetical protein IPL36_03110 [Nigerium sp.]|nr:hypothetical protein [Nigerium sp.]
MLWTGRTGRAASDDKPAADAGYDPDTDRKNAAEILDQARWLIEQHEKRSDSAQKMAAAVLAFTGTVVTFVLKGMPGRAQCWQQVGMGVVLLSGLVTAWLALLALLPRARENGMPAIGELRELAAAHDAGRTTPIPVNQFAADLLNAKHPDAKSPSTTRATRPTSAWTGWRPPTRRSRFTFAAPMVLMFLVAVIP